MRRVIVSTGLILFFILLGTVVAILYANGFQFSAKNGKFLQGTGLLVLSSTPDGARVLINGHLTTATNNTINLTPGQYDVRIEKEGYFTWKKNIDIKEMQVSQANAVLFPNTPNLQSLTNTGADNVTTDETGTLIAYTVSSSSARTNGVYLINMSARSILPIGGLATQLADDTVADFSNANLAFSPDGSQLLASISASLNQSPSYYLLSTNSFNANPQDVTNTLLQVQLDWQNQQTLKEQHDISSLSKKLRPIANRYFGSMTLSPLDNKILYTASASGTLAKVIVPPLEGVDSTPEIRTVKKGNVYVYDIKEDRNYLIYTKHDNTPNPQFIWHPDSNHLAYIEGNLVNIMEYDGQNNTTLYAGPFDHHFLAVWPDGSQLIIRTNLNIPNTPDNLYRLSLR